MIKSSVLNAKKVSFIIAAYNEELYIEECIRSCLEQSYSNIEVCITDDGSTDSTWKILKKTSLDSRVKIHRFNNNKGKVSAFNRSFEMATGSYIAIIGADDVNYLNRVELQLEHIIENNCDLVWGGYEVVDESLNYISNCIAGYSVKDITFENILERSIVPGGVVFSSYKFMKKIFPIPSALHSEDWWIGYKSILMGKVEYLNVPLIRYRQHDFNSFSGMSYSNINELKSIYSSQLVFYNVVKNDLEVASIDLRTKKRILRKINTGVYYRSLFLERSKYKRLIFFLKNIKCLPALSIIPIFKLILLIVFGINFFLKIRNFFGKNYSSIKNSKSGLRE